MATSDALEFRNKIRTDLKNSSFAFRASIDVGGSATGDFFRLARADGNQRILSLKYFAGFSGADPMEAKLVLLSTARDEPKIRDLNTGFILLPASNVAGQGQNVYGVLDGSDGRVPTNISHLTIAELISNLAFSSPSVTLALEIIVPPTESTIRLVFEGDLG